VNIPVVIIGAGQAGGRAAEALRRGGHTGPITIVGDEVHPPYERPSLSKEFLADADLEKVAWVRPAPWYAENGITLVPGRRATRIDRAGKIVTLDDGTNLPYVALILATGGRPRLLPLDGAGHPRVTYLRTIDDSRRLFSSLRHGARIVVIGAGFIGLEVAAAARARGAEVTVLEIGERPMARGIPALVGAFYADLHRTKGIDLRFGASVERIVDADGSAGVELGSGETIKADAVVVGIGIIPNDELAAQAGLEVDNGIVVDAYGRTSDPAIYAAGDATNHLNPRLGRRIRLESWQNAQNQAIAVARNILGAETEYAEVPWFWSDQFGVNLQIAGIPEADDEVIRHGTLGEGPVLFFHLRGGKLVAAIGIDSARDIRFAKEIIALGGKVTPAELADPSIGLANIHRALKQAAKEAAFEVHGI
jgi:NADPH-dependent 2,4-dienoyl-CoA reductase/sulfur reductase-like enzyme